MADLAVFHECTLTAKQVSVFKTLLFQFQNTAFCYIALLFYVLHRFLLHGTAFCYIALCFATLHCVLLHYTTFLFYGYIFLFLGVCYLCFIQMMWREKRKKESEPDTIMFTKIKKNWMNGPEKKIRGHARSPLNLLRK